MKSNCFNCFQNAVMEFMWYLYKYKTNISLNHFHSAWPYDLDITRHIDCALGFSLLTQAVKHNVCFSPFYTRINRLYRVSIHVTLLDISMMQIRTLIMDRQILTLGHVYNGVLAMELYLTQWYKKARFFFIILSLFNCLVQ